jgi:hypothetical protein
MNVQPQFKVLQEYSIADTQTIEIPTREEIDEKYKWNLKDIYSSDEEWEKDFKFVEGKYYTMPNLKEELQIHQ